MTDETAPRPTGVLEVTRELVDEMAAFIRARLDEMEQRARAVAQLLAGFDRPASPGLAPLDPLREYALSHSPREELSDVAAMRRLLEHFLFMDGLFVAKFGREAEALIVLASRWYWHPEFQELLKRHERPIDAAPPIRGCRSPAPANGVTDA